MNITDPKTSPDLLTATASFRLTEAEWRTLQLRAQRTVSQLVRILLRNVLQHA